ncbi:MAG TPA: hypothetical protein VGH90_03045 [Chthoniobacteraceae bacterium]
MLHTLETFRGITANLDEESYSSLGRQNGWLARRITANAFEIWTSKHGWLFDGSGNMLHQAHPPRTTGWGREWYGAFLPDGKWITTDLSESDETIYQFSTAGTLLKTIPNRLLTEPPGPRVPLIGWARSNRDGSAWIINVGSEEGYATVRLDRSGATRTLDRIERWQECFPRALGPRGSPWEMTLPDDSGRALMTRSAATHGGGYPWYGTRRIDNEQHTAKPFSEGGWEIRIPYGEPNFGFWPGKESAFICSSLDRDGTIYSEHTRKFFSDAVATATGGLLEKTTPIVDKTWCLSEAGKLQGFIRGWRLSDAADGRSMLFRLSADSRIVTLRPDLTIRAIRQFIWPDGAVADAVVLWDDSNLGLFIRKHRLILARWSGHPR